MNGLNRPTKFSPDQFRGPPSSTAYMGGSSAAAASIVSPVANRRKPLRLSNPSPKASTRSGRTRSDAERPSALGSAHNRKGSADSDVVHASGRGSGSAGKGTPLQRQSTETAPSGHYNYTDV